MHAIRIRKKIEAAIPELASFIGKTVELIVLEETAVAPFQQLESEETFFGQAPPCSGSPVIFVPYGRES